MFRSLVKLCNSGEEINTKETFGDKMIDVRELLGFSIVTPKGIIGEVADFAVEEPSRKAIFVIVNTNKVFSEHNLLVGTEYIEYVDFEKQYLHLTKTIDEIRS
jgi:sporulation protein YlmC with PRC-barrel domain